MKSRALHALERLRLLRPAYRVYERLQALAAQRRRAAPRRPTGCRCRPPELIVRVAGTADTAWFLEGGRLAADGIRAALERAGRPIEGLGAVLDFGCGCGRVTRRWRGLDGVRIAGTDANEDAIAWCAANLPFGEFEPNGLEPPLPFADDTLRRGLRPLGAHPPPGGARPRLAGRAAAGAAPRRAAARLDARRLVPRAALGRRARRFDAGELVVRWESAAGTNLCAAYHPEPYLRGRLAEGFEVVEIDPQGATGNPHQDLTVLKRL